MFSVTVSLVQNRAILLYFGYQVILQSSFDLF